MRITPLKSLPWIKLSLSLIACVSIFSSAFSYQQQGQPEARTSLAQSEMSTHVLAGELDSDDDEKPSGKLNAAEQAALEKAMAASIAEARKVEPLALLKAPTAFLNKKVTFTGTFNGFSGLGLDYQKALRDSRDYVSFSILRPDVLDHTIPLSELKLFFPRKKSAEVTDLESGDTVQVVGTPFSAALGEPWLDVDYIKVLQKNKAEHSDNSAHE